MKTKQCLLMVGFVLVAYTVEAAATNGDENWETFDIGFTMDDRWQPVAGRWRLHDNQYCQEDVAANGAYAFFPEVVVSDFEYSVRLRVGAKGGAKNAALVFRSTDSRHFYYAQVGVGHKQIILVRAAPEEEWIELDRHRDLPLRPGEWFDIKVRAVSDRIQVFLDGDEVLSVQDATLPAGCVGLRTGQARVCFAEPRLSGRPAELETPWSDVNPVWRGDEPVRLQGGKRGIAASGEVGAGMFPKTLLLPNGEIIAVIRGGAPHIGAGGRLDIIRSEDGGRGWSKPKTMFCTSDDDRGPTIGQAKNGDLVCLYRIYDRYDEEGNVKQGAFDQLLMRSLSTDQGHTWSEPEEVKLHVPSSFVAPFQRIVTLADGTLLMPAYVKLTERHGDHAVGPWSIIVRSHDNGRTWGEVSFQAHGYNETALLALPDGRLLAAMRAQAGGLSTCYSSDQGRTWTEPRRVTARGRHPADLLILPSGHILLAYGRRVSPRGIECRLSRDMGKTWSSPVSLGWTAANGDCGYPSGVVTEDGTVVMLWYAAASAVDSALGHHCEAVLFRETDLLESLKP